MEAPAQAAGAYRAYDTSGDGRADFFTFTSPAGRVDRIGYDYGGDEKPDAIVNIDALSLDRSRHLVIILDGFSHHVVKAFYDAGGLRMFHSPSRVVSPYPSLTDLCMEDILGYMPCTAFQARHYDRRTGKIAGGAWDYLHGGNQPYNRILHYRANLIMDPVSYVLPREVFNMELGDAKETFDRRETQEVLVYFVSSAGVGTKDSVEGQMWCLQGVERMVSQVLAETRGLT
ncbi:unnamed protein product, partial [marine sediment metagenome]